MKPFVNQIQTSSYQQSCGFNVGLVYYFGNNDSAQTKAEQNSK
jgi:hypothetical protein